MIGSFLSKMWDKVSGFIGLTGIKTNPSKNDFEFGLGCKKLLVRGVASSKTSSDPADNKKCGNGFGRSGISNRINAKMKAKIPTIEATTPNLFQMVSRLNL